MKLFLKLILLFFAISVSMTSVAQDLPDPMSPPRLVNDFAEIFTPSEKNDLEQMLLNYNDSTSTQIYVVTVKDLQGYDAGDYATRLGEKWGVGQKGKNNGAVILIKPKIGNERGKVFISVGYGLEEKLPDGRIGRIMDQNMIPYLQQNDYYNGVKSSILAMIQYLSGEYQADGEEDYETSAGDIIFAFIILGIFIFIIYQSTKNGGNNGGSGNRSGGGFYPPIFRGGSGRSSGGFGGGFGGGGGGSFGGGGAGRSW